LEKIKFVFIELHPPNSFDEGMALKFENHFKKSGFETKLNPENSTLIAKLLK